MADVLDTLRAEKQTPEQAPPEVPRPPQTMEAGTGDVLDQLGFESGMERRRRAPARPAPGAEGAPTMTLTTAGQREPERGFSERVIRGVNDMLAGMAGQIEAAGQRTSPVVRDLEGEFIRPLVGEQRQQVTSEGTGTIILGPDGQPVPFDPESMVVLDDPQSGKRLVFERTKETNESLLPALGRFIGVGAVTGPVTRIPGGAGMAARSEPAAAQLMGDFERVSVDPTLPAVKSEEFGRPSRVLGEVPVVGSAIKKGVSRFYQQMADATERLAEGFGTARTAEEAGGRVQRGVERFVRSPADEGAVKRPDVVIRNPASKTSYTTKRDAFYRRADRLIPAETRVKLNGTRKALKEALGKFSDDELAEIYQNNRLAKIFRALEPPAAVDPRTGEKIVAAPKDLKWSDARQLRTELRKLKDDEILLKDIDQAALDRVYSALTDDLHATAAKVGPEALRRLKQADKYTAMTVERIKESLEQVTRAQSPEAAYRVIERSLKEKGGNLAVIRALKRSLKPEEWSDVAATVIHNLGKPTAGRVDPLDPAGFSPSTFVTEYSKLSPKARTMLFSGPELAELRESLDSLVRVAGAAKRLERSGNPSGSGSHLIIAGATAAFMSEPLTTTMNLVAGGTAAQLMMSPKFVRWLTKGLTIKNAEAATRHLAGLRALGGAADVARLSGGAGGANIAGAQEELAKREAGAVPQDALAEFAQALNFVTQTRARVEGTEMEASPDLRVRSRPGATGPRQ